jgi:hypothetical protein
MSIRYFQSIPQPLPESLPGKVLAMPPFTPDEAPACIGTAVFFHYINRMVTILLGSSPLPLKNGIGKTVSMRLGAWYFLPAIRREKSPGTSLGLLPAAELPNDLSWAKSSSATTGAFARLCKRDRKGRIEFCSGISPEYHQRDGAEMEWKQS